ncbi:MAG: NAD(P)-dependent oxidoreductase [Actinomycetes bacterium]
MTSQSVRWRLASLLPLPADAVRAFVGDLPVDIVVPESRDTAGLHDALRTADLALGDFSGELRIGAAEVAVATRLAFVQQPSVGVELIDLDACAAAGVVVSNCAGANDISVAEWCLAATLDICRSMTWADGEVRRGGWPQLDMSQRGCSELAGKRVGIVGFGPIGVACARMFAALDCPVSYWTRRRRSPDEEYGATYRELDDLVAASDVLVVVIARGPSTAGLLSTERLGLLPRGAYLVNAARGGIVDESALVAALDSGALAGAALDVFGREPLPADSPLRQHGRILLSPHVAGATQQGTQRVVQMTVANLRRAISGEPVVSVCNGLDPVIRKR